MRRVKYHLVLNGHLEQFYYAALTPYSQAGTCLYPGLCFVIKDDLKSMQGRTAPNWPWH